MGDVGAAATPVEGRDEFEDADTPPAAEPAYWELLDQPGINRSLRRLPGVTWSAIRFVWAADRRSFVLTLSNDLVAGVLSAVQVLVVAALLSQLLSHADPADAARAAAPWVFLLVLASVVASVMNALVRGRMELFQERVGYAASHRLLAVASNVDLLAFESPAFYDRMQRVQVQSQFRPMQVVQSITQLLSGVASSVGVIVALAVLQPWLVPVVFLAYLPVTLAMSKGAWTEYRFVRGFTQLERRRVYVSAILTERETAKEVRAFGLRQFFLDRYGALWRERERELNAVVTTRTRSVAWAEVLSAVLNGLVIGSLLLLLGHGRLSIAAAGAVLSGLMQLRSRVGGITYGAAGLFEAVLFLDDQRDVLALAAELERRRPTQPAPTSFETLTVDDVSFSYPESAKRAVDRVSIEIRRGEIVALVGENGSGKTTLAKLLGHLYEPTEGAIRWDGIDVRHVDPERLRAAVTVVFQDFVQYNLSAADNIGLGDVTRRQDRPGIEAAAQRSGADRFLRRLPEGYDAILGRMFDTGQDLSIGQWQRVAVARAFFRDAPFVILDEPTAALDARAEHELFERIRSLFVGRTVLLISHRFSTVRSADRIYVLDRGRIIEAGRHDDLVAAGGTYAELFNLQASAFVAVTPGSGRGQA
ncbi:MAG TPA: ABC transporter ATP-binding protein [Acidimicrobiales bacterium]